MVLTGQNRQWQCTNNLSMRRSDKGTVASVSVRLYLSCPNDHSTFCFVTSGDPDRYLMTSPHHSGNLRWVDYARRSMQRLGFVKWTLSLATANQARSLESVTRALEAAVNKPQAVPSERRDAFVAYVRQHQLHQRYSGDNEVASQQDIYLSDPALPSQSGAITGELDRKGYRHAVFVEIPTWATRLQLLRPENYTLTSRGQVLLTVNSAQGTGHSNPLILGPAEQYVALYAMLDVDGDFIRAIYTILLAQRRFSRSDAGDAALDALKVLRASSTKQGSLGVAQALRTKMDRVILSMQNQTSTGLGPKDSVATPRTEPLVDCGLLRKPDKAKYEYEFTPQGTRVLTSLVNCPTVSDFLDAHLTAAITGQASSSEITGTQGLQLVERTYNSIKTGIGYVSLRDLAIGAVSTSIHPATDGCFEIASVENCLRKLASMEGRHVRIAAGRVPGRQQVRIDHRAFASA